MGEVQTDWCRDVGKSVLNFAGEFVDIQWQVYPDHATFQVLNEIKWSLKLSGKKEERTAHLSVVSREDRLHVHVQ